MSDSVRKERPQTCNNGICLTFKRGKRVLKHIFVANADPWGDTNNRNMSMYRT